MMARKKKRNYRAEYKRRIARALAKGYSRSVARGHAKTKTRTYVKRDGTKGKEVIHVEMSLKAAKLFGEKPGTLYADVLRRDAIHVFGEVPRRIKGEDKTSTAYQLRLEGLARFDGKFNWLDEGAFIREMMAAGLTEREAYTHWFSP
jgi:hypothetical protein